MTNRYYTPTYSEFREGFEYEIPKILDDNNDFDTEEAIIQTAKNIKSTDIWVTCFHSRQNWLGYSGEDYLPLLIKKKLVRVKCFDDSDILYLGWEENESHADELCFTLDYHLLSYSIRANEITIINNDNQIVFYGTPKNKSVFKDLMEILNIKQ